MSTMDEHTDLGEGGIHIDISGPEGNTFVLAGTARTWAKQLGWNDKEIADRMYESDYANALAVFLLYFNDFAVLENIPMDLADEVEDRLEEMRES